MAESHVTLKLHNCLKFLKIMKQLESHVILFCFLIKLNKVVKMAKSLIFDILPRYIQKSSRDFYTWKNREIKASHVILKYQKKNRIFWFLNTHKTLESQVTLKFLKNIKFGHVTTGTNRQCLSSKAFLNIIHRFSDIVLEIPNLQDNESYLT